MDIVNKVASQTVIGVDMGGKRIRAGRINNIKIKIIVSDLVPKTENAGEVTDVLIKLLNQVVDKSVAGIGIGVPSLVDSAKGIVFNVQNIPSWKEIYLKEILEKELGIPVYINI